MMSIVAYIKQNLLALIFIAACFGGTGYIWLSQKVPCKAPITFKIGTVDSGFGVSQSDFLKDINQAADIWSTAIDRPLFQYDPNGELTINLVYDTRQQTTQEESKLNTEIDQGTQTAASVKMQYLADENQYAALKKEYDALVAQYTAAHSAYNQQVQYWNGRGGAPSAEYNALETEKNNLTAQADTINSKGQQLTDLATEINARIDKYNSLVTSVNDTVAAFNNDGLAGTQFEEGVYVSNSDGQYIDIYQFDSQTAFIRVLAHELGHALGLGHNSDPVSIMNPVNTGTNLTLSPEDLQELKTECNIK